MDVREYVLSAGRAVLDMVEREWQPLSAGELEQRLDQAVEEVLEAELIAKLKTQPPAALYVQLLQSQANVQTQVLPTASSSPEEETSEPRDPLETVDSAAVKVSLSLTNMRQLMFFNKFRLFYLCAVHIKTSAIDLNPKATNVTSHILQNK